MPSKPKKPCNKPACYELTTDRYCHKHKDASRQDNRHYDRHIRDKRSTTFYHSVEWSRARQAVMTRDNGLCQHCLLDKRITIADMVHHRFPVKTHWHFRLVLTNLVALCNSCHAKIDHSKIGG